MADKPTRDPKPKGALRCYTVAEAAVEEKLAELNAAAKPGREWRQDKATRRARKMGEAGLCHLCEFETKPPKSEPKKNDKKTEAKAKTEAKTK